MRRLLNVSRPCYDKFQRCPGWNGGGIRFARRQLCDHGFLGAHLDVPHWEWRTTRCPRCGVLVLPYRIRWADPAYWVRWKLMKDLPRWIGDWRREFRR